jgi:hypothetical protein
MRPKYLPSEGKKGLEGSARIIIIIIIFIHKKRKLQNK